MKVDYILLASLTVVGCGGGGGDSTPDQFGPEAIAHYYVSPDDDCGGNSPCLTTIRAAVESAAYNLSLFPDAPRRTIHVGPGTYTLPADTQTRIGETPIVAVWFPVDIVATDGPETTIISGEDGGAPCVWVMNGARGIMRGFTVTKCQTWIPSLISNRFAVYIDPDSDVDFRLEGNRIVDNVTSAGAIYVQPYFVNFTDINITIDRNVISGNQGGIYVNAGTYDGSRSGQWRITNNVIYGNHSDSPNPASALSIPQANSGESDFDLLVANNTLFDNDIGFQIGATGVTIINNIFWGHAPAEDFGINMLEPNHTIRNNIAATGDLPVGTDGNMNSDPSFVSDVTGDFRLRSDSPAIDAGWIDSPPLGTMDNLGNPRVLDGDGDGQSQIDIGAIEYVPPN